MGSENSKDSSSSHGSGPNDQSYTTDVTSFEAEQMKMREISRMDQTIRSRLHQGVKYNMKVLICGEKKTGKTVLWQRLQGLPFSYEVCNHLFNPLNQVYHIDHYFYSFSQVESTPEIQVLHETYNQVICVFYRQIFFCSECHH